MYNEIIDRILRIHESLFSCVKKYGNKSSSLEAFTFSDSIFVRWKDCVEGARICIPFSRDFWNGIQGLPYRVFIENVDALKEHPPISQQIIHNKRFVCVTPISYAFWSVCIAESSHFPEGIFLGKNLWDSAKDEIQEKVFEAGKFLYKKLLIP